MDSQHPPKGIILEDGEILTCPTCGGTWLHQGVVRVLERQQGEDGDGLETLVIAPGVMRTQPIAESEMPGRRNSLQIHFDCEQCDFHEDENGEPITVERAPGVRQLQIAQHKGQTFIAWIAG